MDGQARGPVSRRGRTIERYLTSLTVKPFAATLMIVLPALLLERLLRLFDLLAYKGVPAGSVGQMLVDLVPQYLGLALPAALFIGVHLVIARLSATNELEAMQNAGLSMGRISRPFFIMGVIVMVGAYGLYGYVQPMARYAYRAAFWSATQSGWNAILPPGQIIHVSKNLVVTADASDRKTGVLSHILIYQRKPDGTEQVTTGRTGTLSLTDGGTEIALTLNDGKRLEFLADGRVEAIGSAMTNVERPFDIRTPAFRLRGTDEREMTLGELWSARFLPDPPLPVRCLNGELYSRIIRSLSIAVLPLLAVSVGVSAKRAKRQYGIVVGLLILVLYDHAIQLTAALGTAGLIDPRLPLCGIFLGFTAFCAWMFRRATRHTSEGPLDPLFAVLEDATDRCLGALQSLFAGRHRRKPYAG